MKVWMICLFAIYYLDKFGNYLSEAKEGIRGLENRGGREGPLTEAFAVVGGHVLLPCNMDPPVANDSTHLVLFYYGDAGTPIYSLDSRGSRLESATHWADSSVVSRAFVSTDPGQRGLLLEKVTLSDQGHYRCRVDFLESPTRNSRIKLTVVIPPKRLEIFSSIDTGRNLRGMVGPYTLGTEVVFTCKVTGGSPRPLVSWWRGETMVDNLSEVRKGDVTSNEIYQPPLTRYDFNKTLTCKASNSDLVEPLKSSISIDMTYPPTSILLAGGLGEVHLTEGETKRISCEVRGSRPPAKVIWRMGDQRLHSEDLGIQEEILRSGATRSYFTYLPRLVDDDEVLECSAYNPSMPKIVLRNSTKLAILYKPRMELRPESAFELDTLMEGSDVTLRCIVDANPAVTGVQWSHNGVPIQANSGHTVKVTQGTLTLRRISRFTSGNYTCAAANTEGGTTSNVLHLQVKFPPVCTAGQQKLFGAAKHEELFVPCQVSAFPPPTSFRWAINTTRGMSDIHFAKATRTGSVSTLRYTAKTSLDFGELLCWATNDVATQRAPCVYKVIPAAKPHSVTECVADRNASMPASYVSVFCKEGWGGGLNQSFTLEVRQRATEEVLEKFSLASKPNFHISGLKLGVPYLLTVTAANSRGSSPPVTIPYTPPKASADKVISPVKEEPTTSNTPLILGIVGPLVGVAICIGVFVFIRNRGFFWGTTGQLKMAISRSFGNLQDLQELPSFGPRYKDKRASLASLDEMQINSNGPGSPISIYQRTGRMLNNSTTSLDNDVIFLRENQPKMPDYKAPLARADSIDSAASDMRTYYARASRPASFRSHCSAPLNPEQLLREEYLRRELARSMYLGDFLPPMPPMGGYLMSNHHLAKSDNLLRDNTYVRNDFFEPYEYEVPPPYLETMATFRRQPKGKKADHNLKSYGSMNIL